MAGRDQLRERMLHFMRKAAPYAYCDPCLALRLDAAVTAIVPVLTDLVAEGVCERRRRACYGCRRTLELAALLDSPPPR